MESGLRQLFERHHVPVGCHLLGDSGYPCKTWLLTPYFNPQPGAQLKYNMMTPFIMPATAREMFYNRKHTETRGVIERTFGILKMRFRCLDKSGGTLQYSILCGMLCFTQHFHESRYRPQHYAERPNLLEHYSNDELYARYRFGRDDIAFICNILRPHLECATLRSHALTVEEQVLIALHFYASGSFFEVIGDGLAVRMSAVGHVVHSVSSALTNLLGQFVKWPENEDDMARTKRKFFSLVGGGVPNTIGVIDCTHVHIQAPHAREWDYVNRKGRHSINVQLVGNADLVVTNCVVRWPGSVHDARILRASHLFQRFQQNTPDGILLGDSGYPLLPWLMTPFATVANDSQQRYNSVHATTRGTIERLNGVIKCRFASKACHIICACIVLHNIAQTRRVPLQEALIDGPPPCAEVPDLLPPQL
ncbi:putative nuclease HARBI1 [Merluccius polli]|uniref:Putative nuclease HARBI1 n=1 Tax=Merluccius polli TaxID=89951 RepID=A0AA47NVI4_MERPO|nr:putative nuclease HARBI1 [Merluccius polli]